MDRPLVSVIIPSYNHHKYVQKTIESVMNQSYDNFELIVIDDGSTDNSRNILAELAQKYKFTLVFQENQGIAKTLNYAIKNLAKGKYIAAVSSDDYWDKENLAKKIQFLEDNPKFSLCFSNIYIIEGNNIYKCNNRSLKSGWLFNDYILGKCSIFAVAIIAQRQALLDTGLYDPNPTLIAEDRDLTLRIAKKYQIGYIDEPLVYYRYHTNNNHKNTKKMTISLQKSLDKWKHESIYIEAKKNMDINRFYVSSIYAKSEALKMLPNLLINYKTLCLMGICRLFIPKFCWIFMLKFHAFKNRLKTKNGYVAE